MNIEERRKLPNDMQNTIRSACCDAKCTTGEAHDFGMQYCAKCKEACGWRTTAPSVAAMTAKRTESK